MRLGRFVSPYSTKDWKLSNFITTSQKVKSISLRSKQWTLDQILNQADTPHCVGFSCAGFGNCLPVDDEYRDDDGHWFYYRAKEFDGEAGAENGSCMRSGALALRLKGRINAFAFAKNIWEIIAWIQSKGPLLIGTNWYEGMFDPDKAGYVKPTGLLAGGHAYLLTGFKPLTLTFTFANSWGAQWGLKGMFKMRLWDFARLLSEDGEAVAAVELPK